MREIFKKLRRIYCAFMLSSLNRFTLLYMSGYVVQ